MHTIPGRLRSKPLAIILDVDLAYSDKSDGKALKDFLGKYEPGRPPLLLVRDLIDDPDGGLPQPRPTDYDGAVGSKDNIMFTSPLFERDGDERRARKSRDVGVEQHDVAGDETALLKQADAPQAG